MIQLTNVIFDKADDFVTAMLNDTVNDPLVQRTGILYGNEIWNGNGKVKYLNLPCAFDIETTSTFTDDEETDKVAFMYTWQFGYYADTSYNMIMGRTWESFCDLISSISANLDLSNERRLIVYVHNLAFEFAFMREHFNWANVFFADYRKPIYALTSNFVEFRCSLKLSGGKSLATVGKELAVPVEKMVGDLDYSLLRGPQTPLSEAELHYCEQDIAVVLQYIREKIEQDDGISNIPLTNTGYVRRHMREVCFPIK